MTEGGVCELINFWKKFKPSSEDFCVHQDDYKVMMKKRWQGASPTGRSSVERFFEQLSSSELGDFHLSLTPVPYVGNLNKADIFLLMINPSLGYADYGTDANPDFCEAITKNRNQDFSEAEQSCLALNFKYWDRSWFFYYEKLLRRTVRAYAEKTGVSYLDALDVLSRRLAILELVPYYSGDISQFGKRFLRELTSAQKARDAAQELLQRAQNDTATVIVRWGSDKWGLAGNRTITHNTGRNGFSEGQEAILKRLSQPIDSQIYTC